ncbi:MAG: hypothetical protein KDA85_12380, partial [Planctomycetaceae bacterium]|nr:hypothetical protein [Planctomycetaceae bacterium]
RDFFEGCSAVVVNGRAKRGLVTYTLGERGGARNSADGVTSRVVLVDLSTGRLLANVVGPGKWVGKAIHPDGERFVLEGQAGEDSGKLATCTASGKKMNVLDLWVPFGEASDKDRFTRLCQFADEKRLVTSNESGTVAIWDFDQKQIESSFRIPRTSVPAISPDGKHIGFCGGDRMGIFRIETQDAVGARPAPLMNFWVRSCFSPSGKYLAAASQQKLMIWDLATADVVFEGDIPGLNLAFGLEFPDDDFVLISNEYLVEWKSRIKVWQYTNGGGNTNCEGGYTFFANGAIMPAKIPHPEALRMLDEAQNQSDLFVVKKGASIRVDVSGVPDQYRQEVSAGLTKQVEAVGCVVADSAPVTLKATISAPSQTTVSYFRLGDFAFTSYTSSIQYVCDGQIIWSGQTTNQPGMLQEKRDKSWQQQIDEAASKPNLYYFKTVKLPEFLQKPQGPATPGKTVRAQQTIGVSKITTNGIE